MREELSSRSTFLAKFVVPGVLLLVCLFGAGATAAAGRDSELFFALTLFMFLVSFLMGRRLKRVRVAGDGLLISDYSDEVEVKYSEILEVSENKLGRDRSITMT